jgi:hypothetical protein
VISIDFVDTGLGVVAPTPAVGTCAAAWTPPVVRMAPYAAPFQGTGLSAVRLRDLAAGTAVPSVEHIARTGLAVSGVPAQRTTPGDLPPEDPLS